MSADASMLSLPDVPYYHAAAMSAGWENALVQPGNRFDRIEVFLRPDLRDQTIRGMGGAFSAIGGEALRALNPDVRRELLRRIYADAGLAFCRTPIGASDFARRAYALCESREDLDLFTLGADEDDLLPFLRGALEANPGLRLHASPWSPPAWLKKNGSMCDGGGLLDGRAAREDLAAYLLRYVQLMNAEGLQVERLMVQNEMDVTSKYPSCPWAPEDFAKFHRDILRPALNASGLDVELWAGTFRSSTGLQIFEALAVPGFRDSIDGLGLQYTRLEVMQALRLHFRGLPFMHTESICYDGRNSWEQAVALFFDFLHTIRAGSDAYSYWNTILPEDGLSGWGWRQNSLVTVDRWTGTFALNPDFHVLAWISANVPPGSTRIEAYSFHCPTVGFERPDGSLVALLFNSEEREIPVFVHSGGKTSETRIPPRTFGAVGH